ncbi:hypothetical protein BaRGS_00017424 [Batillaria attramentaria]|uniref:Uncharacterized protein n=1 Tax=Batillaria attramentaria TaxID=370345 RepID=A0ABD0KVZ5_9CAEN
MATRPKFYHPTDRKAGCCICALKSSSSRYAIYNAKKRFTEDFLCAVFRLSSMDSRRGYMCNPCVLLVKRCQQKLEEKEPLPDCSDRVDSFLQRGAMRHPEYQLLPAQYCQESQECDADQYRSVKEIVNTRRTTLKRGRKTIKELQEEKAKLEAAENQGLFGKPDNDPDQPKPKRPSIYKEKAEKKVITRTKVTTRRQAAKKVQDEKKPKSEDTSDTNSAPDGRPDVLQQTSDAEETPVDTLPGTTLTTSASDTCETNSAPDGRPDALQQTSDAEESPVDTLHGTTLSTSASDTSDTNSAPDGRPDALQQTSDDEETPVETLHGTTLPVSVSVTPSAPDGQPDILDDEEGTQRTADPEHEAVGILQGEEQIARRGARMSLWNSEDKQAIGQPLLDLEEEVEPSDLDIDALEDELAPPPRKKSRVYRKPVRGRQRRNVSTFDHTYFQRFELCCSPVYVGEGGLFVMDCSKIKPNCPKMHTHLKKHQEKLQRKNKTVTPSTSSDGRARPMPSPPESDKDYAYSDLKSPFLTYKVMNILY